MECPKERAAAANNVDGSPPDGASEKTLASTNSRGPPKDCWAARGRKPDSGRAVRIANAGKETRIHSGVHFDVGVGHRRQHRDLQRSEWRSSPAAAISQKYPPVADSRESPR